MKIDLTQAAQRLLAQDDILLLCHANPDGDTLGSAWALAYALQAKGKRVQVLCPDAVPELYDFMLPKDPQPMFEPAYIAAVDVATTRLLGDLEERYQGKIDLCIDHHGSNNGYARASCIYPEAAAVAEMMHGIILAMQVEVTPQIADCLYTGIATDTGCFRYANTTVRSHRIAADLMEAGADIQEINRVFFETRSHAYLALERMALEQLRFYYDGKCAIMTITRGMYAKSGVSEGETDPITSVPRQVAGVLVGITLKERSDGTYKASVRTHAPIDASEICVRLGGGGHARAAGCSVNRPRQETTDALLESVRLSFAEAGLLPENSRE